MTACSDLRRLATSGYCATLDAELPEQLSYNIDPDKPLRPGRAR